MAAQSVNTPEGRGHFVSILRSAIKDRKKPDTPENRHYTIKMVFAPGTDITALQKAYTAVLEEKFGTDKEKWPKHRKPFRKNKQLDPNDGSESHLVQGEPDDAIVMTFSSNVVTRQGGTFKPGVVDGALNDIIDETQVYSGAYYRCQVRPYWYDFDGNKGVSFGLQNVQKTKDGEPAGGRVPANKAFDAVETAAQGGSASDAFLD